MKLKSSLTLSAVLAACLCLAANSTGGTQTDPFPAIRLPVYQSGYDIKHSYNRLRGIKTLVYKVQTRYPAAEVLEYYDAVLNGRGWRPSFEICQRHWDRPGGDNIKQEFQARQLFTSWQHPRYRLLLSLRLQYKPIRTGGRDAVTVQCRLQPRLDNTRHDAFIQRLKASGQYPAFAEKLDAYRRPDGQVDPALIEQDLKGSLTDEHLVEYKRILDEQQQEIDGIVSRTNQSR